MARVLIVGCGCRGQALARAADKAGHAVRGTTREPRHAAAIEAAGAEAAVADPDRLGTLTPALEGVTVLCWLMATATGPPERVAALHGSRLESLLGAIVDTPVRGVVYERIGTVGDDLLDAGAAAVRRAADTFRMPVELVERHPDEGPLWVADALRAVDGVLSR